MEQVYNAEIQNNQIRWLQGSPKEFTDEKAYLVEIRILETEDEKPKNDIVEFFRNSPLFGIELDLERSKDTGREIEL